MKDNLMVRMMTSMILLSIILAHVYGQVNLFQMNWLWLSMFAAFMGLQATFTGWCPSNLIGKFSKSGECCPGGSCSSSSAEPKKTESSCCSDTKDDACCSDTKEESCCSDNAEGTCCGSSEEGMVIKVLGSGCANCESTIKRIETVAQEMGVAVNVVAVHDVAKILEYGVMSTPAVVISEEVIHSGSIPSKEKIQDWLEQAPKK
ncbi:thioredoxin family protein [Hydrogenovibrio kuenenii]|uniref:thioredoxin family protein n=1 Tax=Hydrogenovibrio kuenenii TaxID=63658 RepID=UPI000464C446|nr:thioredoxin family protein [Hydrogenovibrio kuenenii]